VIEAESQTVLNTLTEHDFQDAFERWKKCRERCVRVEGDYWWPVGPKLVPDQMAPPVQEIMVHSLFLPTETLYRKRVRKRKKENKRPWVVSKIIVTL
jgi:hypothetical protein